MELHVIAEAAGGRLLVTLAAGRLVEERAQPGLGLEGAVEDDAAAVERVALGAGESADRIAGVEGPGAREDGGGGTGDTFTVGSTELTFTTERE